MRKCDQLIQRFTLKGQDDGVRNLRGEELKSYQLIYDDLIKRLIATGAEVPQDMEIQVINKIVTPDDDNVTPLGLVNVSLDYLTKILTFAQGQGIQWQVEIKECTDTHFKELSYFKITVACDKEFFVTMAKEAGFRYPKITRHRTA
ncbi:hypothetical protein DEAC_c00110 [Desulfosporosinus acididurans]|uniref:Uncharacterized protein n=1 Tax=Desulfosporosinus acididurans TaxID=476652 RepID=A0A0J1FWE8_9FIRM|nr:hypothetical protein [Desulfosporosinus acididurans]KLU67617.1 hypothetical protein DEAC_c00110 [Desulfosporosinus acididurans]